MIHEMMTFPGMSRIAMALTTALVLGTAPCHSQEEKADNRYNVLFICVDDLRAELGCYGVDEIRTPHIDDLAKSALVFNNHYVQVPTCGASRYALLTGRRPSRSKGMGNGAMTGGASALKPDPLDGAQSLPELFKRSGYHTAAIGKISHSPDGKVFSYKGKGDGREELPNAWDELRTPYGQWDYGWGCFFAYANGGSRETTSGKNKVRPVYQHPDVPDNGLPDGMMCDEALKVLGELKSKDKPFFLAVGFYKPHLPFVAPARYRRLYDGVDVKPAINQQLKKTAYWHGSGEFYGYQAPHEKARPLAGVDQIECKKSYYACVSYIDAQIGRLIDRLQALELEKNTVVVIWGDHGWHLGDHAIWGKHSPLEKANRSALIIKVPGMAGAGKRTNAIVESLDIFPTLVDVCQPAFRKTVEPLNGLSLAPVLGNPDHAGKDCALSYWHGARSVRTADYRFIATRKGEAYNQFELYDHRNDPEEMSNIAGENPEVVQRLLRKIKVDKPRMAE
jgi:arylsulfatase A-like enzyme